MRFVETEAELAAVYGQPSRAALVKVAREITPHYRAWIEASPFMALASVGPEGLDCSPRGDVGSIVHVVDATTVAIPDRRGNNRIDTLKNIVRDPRVALMFLIPGSETVLRLNGRGRITVDAEVCAGYAVEGAAPRSVLFVTADEVYFQCARAVKRARLWERDAIDLDALPSIGTMLTALDETFDGSAYDKEWPTRAARTMW